MIPFGDIMLPVIGLVAVGLLIVGVKLFFLSGPKTQGYYPISPSVPAQESQQNPQRGNTVAEAPHQPPEKKTVLAAPVGSKHPSAAPLSSPAGTKESPVASPPPPAARPTKKNPPAPPAKPAQQPVPQLPAPAAASSRWGVQIGSFTAKDGAETVRQQAAKAGYSSVVTSALVSGKRYFRVTVPAGNDRKQADNLAERLKKSGFPVFVVGMR